MRTIKYFFSILLFIPLALWSQQVQQFSNFKQNQLLFNPAAAGIEETELNVGLLTRLQWTSLGNGAPNDQNLWADYKLGDSKSAVGINVSRMSYGVTRIQELSGNYAYHLPVSANWKVGMGLRMGAKFIRIGELPEDRIWDSDDPMQYVQNSSFSIPLAGAGFRISNQKFYAAISAPDLISMDKNNVYGNKDLTLFKKKRNYTMVTGYYWTFREAYRVVPNAMLLMFPGEKARVNLNVNFEIRDYFWAGLTYASNNFHSALVGTHISSALKASYAYQFGLGKNIPGKFNTHEICLQMNLDTAKK